MNLRRLFSLAAGFCLLLGNSFATTVIPPSFEELSSRADTIVQAEVSAVRSEWRTTSTGRIIVTIVSLKVEEALKGAPGATLDLVQIGGVIDDMHMEVSEAPEWLPGDRNVVFVSNNGKGLVPLVAFKYGQFPIVKDAATGAEFVTRANGERLASISQLQSSLEQQTVSGSASVAQAANSLSLVNFKKAVRDQVSGVSGSTQK